MVVQKYNNREFKRLLNKRNAKITQVLSTFGSSKGEEQSVSKFWKEKEKIKRAMQHLKNGKLDEKDMSYFGDLKNCQDNLDVFLNC